MNPLSPRAAILSALTGAGLAAYALTLGVTDSPTPELALFILGTCLAVWALWSTPAIKYGPEIIAITCGIAAYVDGVMYYAVLGILIMAARLVNYMRD